MIALFFVLMRQVLVATSNDHQKDEAVIRKPGVSAPPSFSKKGRKARNEVSDCSCLRDEVSMMRRP